MLSRPHLFALNRSLSTQIPAFVAVRTVINTAIRMVYPFLPVFGRGLGVDLPRLSLALTLRSASGVFSPFLGSVADSRGRKAGMLFGLGLFTIGMTVMALWPGYLSFVAALILSLAGNFVFAPAMQAYLGDRVPYQRRGLMLALTELGWSLSFIACVPLVGWLIDRRGWQAPFPVLAVLGGLSILVLSIVLPRDQAPDGNKPGLGSNLRRVFTYVPALAGLAMSMLLSGSNELVNLIFGVWLEDAFHVQIATLAAASAIIGFSELGGEGLVSALTDRLGKPRAVSVGFILNALVVLALPFLGRDLVGALVGLAGLYITFEFTMVSSLPLMTEILPDARATLMSTFFASTAIGRGLGALLAPVLYHAGQAPGAAPSLLVIALVAAALDLLGLVALGIIKKNLPS